MISWGVNCCERKHKSQHLQFVGAITNRTNDIITILQYYVWKTCLLKLTCKCCDPSLSVKLLEQKQVTETQFTEAVGLRSKHFIMLL